MSYSQAVSEDCRLLILRALANANAYTASGLLLQSFLKSFGHSISHDLMASELAWLAEQGLIEQQMDGAAAIAKLTMRGLDVSQGVAQTPGVRRPRPGE